MLKNQTDNNLQDYTESAATLKPANINSNPANFNISCRIIQPTKLTLASGRTLPFGRKSTDGDKITGRRSERSEPEPRPPEERTRCGVHVHKVTDFVMMYSSEHTNKTLDGEMFPRNVTVTQKL